MFALMPREGGEAAPSKSGDEELNKRSHERHQYFYVKQHVRAWLKNMGENQSHKERVTIRSWCYPLNWSWEVSDADSTTCQGI